MVSAPRPGSIKKALQFAKDSQEKQEQKTNSLNRIDDSFRKIVVVKDDIIPWHDERGILYIGVQEFLLNENAIDM